MGAYTTKLEEFLFLVAPDKAKKIRVFLSNRRVVANVEVCVVFLWVDINPGQKISAPQVGEEDAVKARGQEASTSDDLGKVQTRRRRHPIELVSTYM